MTPADVNALKAAATRLQTTGFADARAGQAYDDLTDPAAILTLVARLEAAEADATRLNWVLGRVRYTQVSEETWRTDVHWHSAGGDLCDRDAIDAAMKEAAP